MLFKWFWKSFQNSSKKKNGYGLDLDESCFLSLAEPLMLLMTNSVAPS